MIDSGQHWIFPPSGYSEKCTTNAYHAHQSITTTYRTAGHDHHAQAFTAQRDTPSDDGCVKTCILTISACSLLPSMAIHNSDIGGRVSPTMLGQIVSSAQASQLLFAAVNQKPKLCTTQ